MQVKPLAFASWSGGKDCALALYQAQKKGVDVHYLLNMANANGKHSRSHHLGATLLQRQAKAMGLKLVQTRASWNNYETNYKQSLAKLKKLGVTTGVFGDIDLQIHRDWVERVCKDCAIDPLLPLWEVKRSKLMRHLLDVGFKAIIVALRTDLLDRDKWLGAEINDDFMKEFQKLKGIDLCGEGGEYHSFIYNGPVFKQPVKFKVLGKRLRKNHAFLELS